MPQDSPSAHHKLVKVNWRAKERPTANCNLWNGSFIKAWFGIIISEMTTACITSLHFIQTKFTSRNKLMMKPESELWQSTPVSLHTQRACTENCISNAPCTAHSFTVTPAAAPLTWKLCCTRLLLLPQHFISPAVSACSGSTLPCEGSYYLFIASPHFMLDASWWGRMRSKTRCQMSTLCMSYIYIIIHSSWAAD